MRGTSPGVRQRRRAGEGESGKRSAAPSPPLPLGPSRPRFPNARRSGRISALWLTVLASVLLLSGLIALLAVDRQRPGLLVYCAPAVKKPVEAAAAEYQRAYGVPTHLDYGPPQPLLTRAEMPRRGDVFAPADDSYV